MFETIITLLLIMIDYHYNMDIDKCHNMANVWKTTYVRIELMFFKLGITSMLNKTNFLTFWITVSMESCIWAIFC